MSGFVLELTITGLVVLGIPVAEGVPETKQPVKVYVLDADRPDGLYRNLHKHRATISFYAEDIARGTFELGRPGVDVHIGPDGRDVVTVEIDRRLLKDALRVHFNASTKQDAFHFKWHDDEPPCKDDHADVVSRDFRGAAQADTKNALQYSPSLAHMNIDAVHPEAITAVIETLPYGTFSSRDLIRDRIEQVPILYKFVPASEIESNAKRGDRDHHQQFVANQIVLTADLDAALDIQVGSDGRFVNLEPADPNGVLRVSVTNLPETARRPQAGATEAMTILHHLRWVARFVPTIEKFEDVRIPIPADEGAGSFGTIQGKICPAMRFHQAAAHSPDIDSPGVGQ